uniref:Uncharacterized protein n=1 Tax=Arundo donax TaxID=35708 RepID=A0A0A9B237_ARUDO
MLALVKTFNNHSE